VCVRGKGEMKVEEENARGKIRRVTDEPMK
jgi:hypothetical protein